MNLYSQVGTNGIFSFGRDFRQDLPQPFPSFDAEVYFSYIVAPYWSNIDTRLDGQVNYEVYAAGESTTADDYLRRATLLINTEQDTSFRGNWMVVATWDGVHPFPHGNSAEQDREDPYLQSVRTPAQYNHDCGIISMLGVHHTENVLNSWRLKLVSECN